MSLAVFPGQVPSSVSVPCGAIGGTSIGAAGGGLSISRVGALPVPADVDNRVSAPLSVLGGALGGAPCFPLRLEGEVGGSGSSGFVRGGPGVGSGRVSEETFARGFPVVSATAI